MKGLFYLTFIFIGLVFFSCKKKIVKTDDLDDLAKFSVEQVLISSVNTNQNYRMRVLLPQNYSETNTYPVIYLLDGYFWFDYLKEELMKLKLKGEMSDVILVGIEYADYPINVDTENPEINELREIDLTYPIFKIDAVDYGGGALLFYDFIKTEAIPKIESKYSINSENRAIFGHSLAGYFTFFQMINFKDDALFKNVVASSPSFWWASPYIFDLEKQVFDQRVDLPFNLYLSVGDFEGEEMNTVFNTMKTSLKSHNYSSLTYRTDKYPTNHEETGALAFVDAFKLIFP